MSKESAQALREAEEALRKSRVARFRGSLINRNLADAEVRRAVEERHERGMKLLDALEALYLSVRCEHCRAGVEQPCVDDGRVRSPRNPHPIRRVASGEREIAAEIEADLKAASVD